MKIARFLIAGISFLLTFLVFLPLLVLVLPFALFMLTYSGLRKIAHPKNVSATDLIQFNRKIGWKPKPDLDTHYFDGPGDLCSVVTDSQGWPGKNSIKEADVVVIGDSFAFGYGVQHQHSYANVKNKIKIKPLAAPGYNMVQQALLFEKYASELQGKRVTWFICFENDLYDNLFPYSPFHYKTPFILRANGSWKIKQDHVKNKNKITLRKSRNYRKFYANLGMQSAFSDRVYSSAEYLIREVATLCDEHDISVVVMGIPSKYHMEDQSIDHNYRSKLSNSQKFNADYIDTRFDEICRTNNIQYVSLRDHLTLDDFKSEGTHWNEQGNVKIAQIIKKIYRNN